MWLSKYKEIIPRIWYFTIHKPQKEGIQAFGATIYGIVRVISYWCYWMFLYAIDQSRLMLVYPNNTRKCGAEGLYKYKKCIFFFIIYPSSRIAEKKKTLFVHVIKYYYHGKEYSDKHINNEHVTINNLNCKLLIDNDYLNCQHRGYPKHPTIVSRTCYSSHHHYWTKRFKSQGGKYSSGGTSCFYSKIRGWISRHFWHTFCVVFVLARYKYLITLVIYPAEANACTVQGDPRVILNDFNQCH